MSSQLKIYKYIYMCAVDLSTINKHDRMFHTKVSQVQTYTQTTVNNYLSNTSQVSLQLSLQTA